MSNELKNKTIEDIHYSQCWEDADVLRDGLKIKSGDKVLSIASAGDNSFALLLDNPSEIVVIDRNPVQIACVEIRRAMYKSLEWEEFLELMGSVDSDRRLQLYEEKVRPLLKNKYKYFWDAQMDSFEKYGVGGVGKFEKYLRLFSEHALPLIHRKKVIDDLFKKKTLSERIDFYSSKWDNPRWRLFFYLLFSRTSLKKLNINQKFFYNQEKNIARQILARVKYGLIKFNINSNPYLTWMFTGKHSLEALPTALRKENYEIIRSRVDVIHTVIGDIEDYLEENSTHKFNAFNMSNIFEYLSEEKTFELLNSLVINAQSGARICYWNMFLERSSNEYFNHYLIQREGESKKLFNEDKTVFYSAFHIDEVIY